MSKTKDSINPADALKTLENIFIVDPRNNHIPLEDWHARIAEIKLNVTVPKNVRQVFENAKNITLYTYFSYRLHQASETIGYIALEKALKEKYEQEKDNIGPDERLPSKLYDYMNIALKYGWIKDEGYSSSRNIAAMRVRDKYIHEIIKSGVLDDGEESVEIPEPNDDEIITEMKAMGLAVKRLHAGRDVRNFLAHGEGGLANSSIGTLLNIAEEINQLFQE